MQGTAGGKAKRRSGGQASEKELQLAGLLQILQLLADFNVRSRQLLFAS